MKQVIARSEFWLAALILLVAGLLAWLGRFAPELMADSASYLEYDMSSLRLALMDVRTFGYPLFLRAVGRTELVPIAQYVAMALAVLIFHRGLTCAGYARWTALWCAGTLLLGRAVIDLGRFVVSDSLAISLTIASAGCFLRIVSSRTGPTAWTAFLALTFLSWQVRPACLFLIPLWPILGFVLDRYLLNRDGGWRGQARRAGTIAVATAVPFLAFGTLRWVIVGHWGVVSFGGYNVVGVAGQIVDEELVPELPADLQPLAARIVSDQRQFSAGEDTDFLEMEARFNDTIWQIAVPAAEELTDGDPVAVNELLSRFSLAVIEERPGRYLGWLFANANHARQQLTTLTVFDKGTFCLGVAYLVLQTVSLFGRREGSVGSETNPPDSAARRRERLLVFWMAIFHSALCCLLVILVEPANDRYMTAGMVLFPAVIAVWVAHAAEDTFPESVARLNRR